MSIGVVRVQSIRKSPAITYRSIEGTYPKIYTRKKDDLEGYERFSRCFSFRLVGLSAQAVDDRAVGAALIY